MTTSKEEEMQPSGEPGNAGVSVPRTAVSEMGQAEGGRTTLGVQEVMENETVVDMEECERLKKEGNKLFSAGNVAGALEEYQKALRVAPIKPRQAAKPADAPASSTPTKTETSPSAAEEGQASAAEETVATAEHILTAQVYGNAGLCLMKLGRVEEAVTHLSESIRHDPTYQKVYLRRADCYYDLQKWSNSYSDYESYEKLGAALDANGRERKRAAKVKVDEEMQKMLGELKNLGNRFLNTFGLSTDNFKFDKDPNTGGYSMRFER